MSFLKNLSGLFKSGRGQTVVSVPQPIQPSAGPTTDEARAKAREIILEAKDEAIKIKQQADQKAREIQSQVDKQQHEIFEKKAAIEKQEAVLKERQKITDEQNKKAQEEIKHYEALKKNLQKKIQQISRLTKDEAQKLVLGKVEQGLTQEIAQKIRQAEVEANEQADTKARQILVDAMYHGATDYVAEYTVSTVKLPNEEIKGRVIGREGRNIRAFEKATGVDVDLDEEGVIQLSSFDSVRREVARAALEKLIADGRIQPSRIEETVDRIKKDIDRVIYKAGEELCHKVKVYNLPKEIVAMLGRFKYRFSYGQNLITHTLELCKLGVHLANEIGANVNLVRLGCLLHDIGKAIPDEEGTHVELGVKFLKRYGIPQEVINCVAEHHEDQPFSSIESTLVYISDAISGARPGARYEDYEEYLERMESLEKIAQGFAGVNRVYAIQAGREVRVVVDPKQLDDDAVTKLAHDIKQKIESEIEGFPGQIKVVVIREFRSEATAK